MSTQPRTPNPPAVGALLRMAWEQLQSELLPGMIAAGYDDLHELHQPLLRHVLSERLRPSELAARLGLSKQAINDLLRDFEEKGYITLVPDAEDGRAKRVELTDRGWGWFTTGSKLSCGVGRRWAAQVGEERYAQFESVLREIVGTE